MANVSKKYVVELTEDEIHAVTVLLGKVSVADDNVTTGLYDAFTSALWGVEDYLFQADIRLHDERKPTIEVWRK